MAEGIRQTNAQLINRRQKDGLGLLREYYLVDERDVDPSFANPVVAGRSYKVRSFDMWDVGNLLMMSSAETGEDQLASFIIAPYYKDLPLFSFDFVYSGEQRALHLEAFDVAVNHDDRYDQGIASLAACADAWSDLPDLPIEPCWCDDVRSAYVAKAATSDQDELALWRFRDGLDLFVKMERVGVPLDDAGRAQKRELIKGFSDRLMAEGTMEPGRWTAALGVEDTERFLDEVFFGSAHYVI